MGVSGILMSQGGIGPSAKAQMWDFQRNLLDVSFAMDVYRNKLWQESDLYSGAVFPKNPDEGSSSLSLLHVLLSDNMKELRPLTVRCAVFTRPPPASTVLHASRHITPHQARNDTRKSHTCTHQGSDCDIQSHRWIAHDLGKW